MRTVYAHECLGASTSGDILSRNPPLPRYARASFTGTAARMANLSCRIGCAMNRIVTLPLSWSMVRASLQA
jgi:hypothetical protein